MADQPFLASNSFNGDGVTTVWEFSFEGLAVDAPLASKPYIDSADVRAELIVGEGDTQITTPQAFLFETANSLRIEPAVPIGTVLRIYRATENRFPLVNYQDLQSVGASDLDLANRQAVYIVQEARDAARGAGNVSAETLALSQGAASAAAASAALAVAQGILVLGDYAAGLAFTTRNQAFRYQEDLYLPPASLTLPYTTDGSGVPEIANFRSIGDAASRSDLANDSDQALGAALVGRSTVSVDGVANLPTPGIASSLYSVAAYYEGGIDGGLLYKYDPLAAKSTHDGGVVISPTVPWDGLRASVDNFLTGVGETDPSGFGCFVAATDVLTPENYGADGTGDETTIFEKLLNAYPARPALEIYIKNVHTVTRQLYVTRPHHIYGNGRGTSKIISSALTLTAPAPLSCGLLVVSSDALSTSGGPITLPAVYVGTSGLRAHIEKLSVESSGNVGIIRGVTANAQCTLDTLLVSSFPSDGISVLASATGTLDGGSYFGNANGTVIQNCSSAFNGGSGYYQKGTDANACMLNRNIAFSNTGSGFLDDSLLGNTHVMCETDGNGAGYDWTAQPRPTYFACYAEGNQGGLEWNGPLSSRVSIFSYQGTQPKAGLAYLGGMTGGSMRAGAELRYADTDQIAVDKGAGATPSTYMGVSKDGIEYRARAADASTFRLTGSYSANYTSLGFGFGPSIHFPPVSVAGNVIAGRPFFPSGASFGTDSAITGSGTAAPVSGTYSRGAIQFNSTPSAGGFIGWVCVTSGTPGTWKTFGAISA